MESKCSKLLAVVLCLICLPTFGQRFMEELPNVAALKARLPGGINKSVFLRGYDKENDGGGGEFIITNSIIGIDNGLKIQSTAGPTFSYVRQFSGPVNPRWFNCKGDGTTDDAVRLQEAITQATSKGYAVKIPVGTFRTTAPINLPHNATITGEGPSSIIYGVLNGIALSLGNSTNVTLSDFAVGGANLIGVFMAGAQNVKVRNLDVSGATATGGTENAGMDIEGGTDITLENIRWHGNGRSHVAPANNADYNFICNFTGTITTNLTFINPRVDNMASVYGLACFSTYNLKIVGANINMNGVGTTNFNDGYGILSYGFSGTPSRNASVTLSTVTNGWGTGIYFNNTQDGEIIGCQVFQVDQVMPDPSLAVGGIVANFSAGIHITDNRVYDSGIGSGIVFSSVTNSTAIGNFVSLSATNRWGIELRGKNFGTLLKGNHVENGDRAIGTTIGPGGSCDNMDIEGNFIRNMTRDGIFVGPISSNTVVRANHEFNVAGYEVLDQGLFTSILDNELINGGTAIYAVGTNGAIAGNMIVGNTIGIQIDGPGYRVEQDNRLSENTTPVVDNAGAFIKTISASTTPSVKDSVAYSLNYAAPVNITDFTDGLPGQRRTFYAANGNATIINSASIVLDGAGDLAMKTGDSLVLERTATGSWHQVGRSIAGPWMKWDAATPQILVEAPILSTKAIKQTVAPSASVYMDDHIQTSTFASSLLGRWGILGLPNGIGWGYDVTGTNLVVGVNGVNYTFPMTLGPAGGLAAFDGVGNISWQLPANIFNFGPQFTAAGTNINLSIGLGTTNQQFFGDTRAAAINLGSLNGTVNLDASTGPEFTALLAGNSIINITNCSDFHNFNILATNSGNFSLSFTFNGATNTFYWNKYGNSTPETNDWGAGLIGEFNFWKIPGRIKAAFTGLGQIGGGGSSGANPTALVGLTPVNGASAFFTRSDAAPALDQTISPTWLSPHIFQGTLADVLKPISLQNTNTTPNNNAALAIPFSLVDDSGTLYEAGSLRIGKVQDWAGAGTANSFAGIHVMNAGVEKSILGLYGIGSSLYTYPGTIGAADPFGSGAGFVFTTGESATAGAQKYSPSVGWQGSGWNPTAAGAVNVQVGSYVIPVQEAAGTPSARWVLEMATTNSVAGAPVFEVTSKSSVILGERINLQTNATDGFAYLPGGNGPPLGTPTAVTGKTAFYYDFANNVVYQYNAGWKAFTQSAAGANWTANGTTNSDLIGNATVNQIQATNGVKVLTATYNNNTAGLVNAGGTVTFLNNSSTRLSKTLVSGGNGAETSVDVKAGNRTSLTVTTNSALQTYFGLILSRFATSTNFTLTATNHYVAATATCTNTLPPAGFPCVNGQIIIVKNVAGTTTVRPAGSDTIDGVAADDTLTAKAAHRYVSDGVSNWEIY